MYGSRGRVWTTCGGCGPAGERQRQMDLQYKAASAREIYSRGSAGTTTTKFSVFLFKKFSRAKRGLVNRIRKKTMRRLDLTQLRPSVKSTARFNTSPCDGGPNLSFIRVDKLLFPPGARVLLHLVVYIYVTCVSTRQWLMVSGGFRRDVALHPNETIFVRQALVFFSHSVPSLSSFCRQKNIENRSMTRTHTRIYIETVMCTYTYDNNNIPVHSMNDKKPSRQYQNFI